MTRSGEQPFNWTDGSSSDHKYYFFSCYCIISLILKDWVCAFKKPQKREINPYCWGRVSGEDVSLLTVEVGFQEKKSVSWLRGDTEPQGKSKSRLVFDLTAVALRLVSLNPHVLTKDCFLNEWGRREQMTSSGLLCSLFRRRGNHTFFKHKLDQLPLN